MYDDYFDEPYYKPSEVEIVLEEYKAKMMEVLTTSTKYKLDEIAKENARLKSENEKLKENEQDVLKRERDVRWKENNLKTEVESEFYKAKLGDILERYTEEFILWFADKKHHEKEKCNLCDDDRKITVSFPNGKTATTNCDCSEKTKKYEPAITELKVLKIEKRMDTGYSSDRRFYIRREYTPSKKSNRYDEEYNEFSIANVLDLFELENVKALRKDMHYGSEFGFKTKEECQKYCDWLNKNNKYT